MYQTQYFFPPPPWFFTAPPIIPQQQSISDNDTIINQGGVQGIQGTQGISGSAVAQGIQGIQGLLGLQGIQGLRGLEGSQGASGIDGVGIQGTQGPSGGSQPLASCCILATKVIQESYHVQPDDCYIGVLNEKSIEIYLPQNPPKGKMLIIKAQQKQIGNKKIYIVTDNGDKIDDSDELVLQSPFESVTLIFNDSWHIAGQAQV
jgi:hypothetical protein